MDIHNKAPNNHIHSLAEQLIQSRIGQWSHVPGDKTVLRIKFLSKESEIHSDMTQIKYNDINCEKMEEQGAFTSEEKTLTLAALATLEKNTGLRFVEVEEGPAELTFAHYSKFGFYAAMTEEQLDKHKSVEKTFEKYELIKKFGNYNQVNGLIHIDKDNANYKNEKGTAASSGNFSGSIPVWIMSLSLAGKEEFMKTLAHEIGHALGLPHLVLSQQQISGSIMKPHGLKKEKLNQNNNGFGDADILALQNIYPRDNNKPVDLFHQGSVYYDTSYGHASVSPVGCVKFDDGPEDADYHDLNVEIVRLRKGLNKNNIRIELLASAQGIKLTFTDNPDASLTIKERSEALLHPNDGILRFKRIKLANGQTLSIDDQLVQTLKEGKQPQWQAQPLATRRRLTPDTTELARYEFTLTGNQTDSIVKDFKLNNDRLVIPELAGRQLHILAQGETLSPDKRNEKHVIFRQKQWVSLNPKTGRNKMEFALVHFDAQGSRSNVFIDVSQTPLIYEKFYGNKQINDENIFLPKESIQEIYKGLGSLNMEIQPLATEPVTISSNKDIHSLSAAIVSLPPQNEAENLPTNPYLSPAANPHYFAPSLM